MKAKILGYDAWQRLKLEAEHNPLCDYVSPDNMDVVVVEDEGKIVGSLGVMRVTHFEGIWVHPSHRGKAGVIRALLRQAVEIPRARGEFFAFGGAAEGNLSMQSFNERLGKRLPLDFYAMWVGHA